MADDLIALRCLAEADPAAISASAYRGGLILMQAVERAEKAEAALAAARADIADLLDWVEDLGGDSSAWKAAARGEQSIAEYLAVNGAALAALVEADGPVKSCKTCRFTMSCCGYST
jgi:hypothetical protein